MPFQNQDIRSTNFLATNLTGGTLCSGGTEVGALNIPQNRFLISCDRTSRFGTGVSAANSIIYSYSFPSGTFKPTDTIEIHSMVAGSSTNGSTKIFSVAVGSGGTTTTDTFINAGLNNNANGTFAGLSIVRIAFTSDSTFVAGGASNQGGFGILASGLVQGTNFSLSSNTIFVSVAGTRPNAAADVIIVKSSEIYQNKI